jgi:transcriptional regulator with XRE-family HTH domain
MEKKILGNKLKALRLLNKKTQEDVRKALGYESTGMISLIERGETGMEPDKINLAAEYFHIHPAILFSNEDIPEKELAMHVNLMIALHKARINPSKHLPAIEQLLELAAKE